MIGESTADELYINSRIEGVLAFDEATGKGLTYANDALQIQGNVSLAQDATVENLVLSSALRAKRLFADNLITPVMESTNGIVGSVVADNTTLNSLMVASNSTLNDVLAQANFTITTPNQLSVNDARFRELIVSNQTTLDSARVSQGMEFNSIVVGTPATSVDSFFGSSLSLPSANKLLKTGGFEHKGVGSSQTAVFGSSTPTPTQFTVTEFTDFRGDIKYSFDSVLKSTEIGSDSLVVTGFATINQLVVQQDSSIDGNLQVNGADLTAGSLNSDGIISATSLRVDSLANSSTVLGDLTVKTLIQNNPVGGIFVGDADNVKDEYMFLQNNSDANVVFKGEVSFNENLNLPQGANFDSFEGKPGLKGEPAYTQFGSLVVNQNSTLNDAFLDTFSSNLVNVSGTLTGKNLQIQNFTTIDNHLNVLNTAAIKSISIAGDTTFQSGLTIQGDLLGDELSMQGSNLELSGNLSVVSNITSDGLLSSGSDAILSSGDISNVVLEQTSASTSDGMYIAGKLTVGGTFTVFGESIIEDPARLAGGFRSEGIKAPGIVVAGTASINNILVGSGGLVADSKGQFQNGLALKGDLFIKQGLDSDDANLNGSLYVSQPSTLNTLEASGQSNFKQKLNIQNNKHKIAKA